MGFAVQLWAETHTLFWAVGWSCAERLSVSFEQGLKADGLVCCVTALKEESRANGRDRNRKKTTTLKPKVHKQRNLNSHSSFEQLSSMNLEGVASVPFRGNSVELLSFLGCHKFWLIFFSHLAASWTECSRNELTCSSYGQMTYIQAQTFPPGQARHGYLLCSMSEDWRWLEYTVDIVRLCGRREDTRGNLAPGSTYLDTTVQVTVKTSSFWNSELHLKPTAGDQSSHPSQPPCVCRLLRNHN